MSRRVRKTGVTLLLALTLSLSAPSAFAGVQGPSFDQPEISPFQRIVRVVKKVLKGALTNADNPSVFQPTPPKP